MARELLRSAGYRHQDVRRTQNMPSDREDPVMRLADEIRHYLAHHPNASDSAEGIALWWISRQRLAAALSDVVRALEHLEREGVVESQPCPGGEVLYRAVSGRKAPDH